MDGHVSSSSTTFLSESIRKHKLNSSTWNEDLYSNIRYTTAWYSKEINKLKDEISSLTKSVKEDRQPFVTVPNNVLEHLISKLPEGKQAFLKDLELKHSNGGNIDVKWLEQLTGLCINDISMTTVDEEQRDNILLRKHCLCASCHDIDVEITFLVEENELEEDEFANIKETNEHCAANKLPRITDLTINVKNEMASFDMRSFLDKAQEEKQLQQFFFTLQTYSKWRKERLKTFHHFKEKYPQIVSFSSAQDESTLAICNSKYPAIRVNIIWKILVSKDGEASLTFDFLSSIPSRLTKGDDTDFLKSLRSKFRSLLKTVGIEKAIEVVIIVMAK